MSYEVADFQTDVIETSRTRPVMVDFWAPWCGPCRSLGPVLEKLASEAGGEWSLVKVNTDVHQDVSVRYGIRGIPAVKMFVDGQVVDEFTGALPEYAVRQWLEKALPSESKGLVEQAENLIDDGMDEEAIAVLERVLADDPRNPVASALLARLLVFDHPEQALALADTGMAAEPRYVQMAESVRNVAAVLQRDTSGLPDEAGRKPYMEGLLALKAGRFDDAVQRFIEVLQVNRFYDDDGARKAGVAIFTLLGDQHPVTRAHRRTFDMWLY